MLFASAFLLFCDRVHQEAIRIRPQSDLCVNGLQPQNDPQLLEKSAWMRNGSQEWWNCDVMRFTDTDFFHNLIIIIFSHYLRSDLPDFFDADLQRVSPVSEIEVGLKIITSVYAASVISSLKVWRSIVHRS